MGSTGKKPHVANALAEAGQMAFLLDERIAYPTREGAMSYQDENAMLSGDAASSRAGPVCQAVRLSGTARQHSIGGAFVMHGPLMTLRQ
jgi:hypothetical protein